MKKKLLKGVSAEHLKTLSVLRIGGGGKSRKLFPQ